MSEVLTRKVALFFLYVGQAGCDRAIPNPNRLVRACRVTEVGNIGQRFQPKEHQVLVLG